MFTVALQGIFLYLASDASTFTTGAGQFRFHAATTSSLKVSNSDILVDGEPNCVHGGVDA